MVAPALRQTRSVPYTTPFVALGTKPHDSSAAPFGASPSTTPGFLSSNRSADSNSAANALATNELVHWVEAYLNDCELRLYSPRTIVTKRVFLSNLIWFLEHAGSQACDPAAIRQFLYYLAHGHEEGNGRFDKKSLNRPARPVTIKDYYRCLRVFFGWLVEQQAILESPMARIAPPLVRDETKAPLSLDQIEALLAAARRSREPLRNVALLLFLLDTGCRAGELVSIQLRDLDLQNGRCRVLGKGGKYRTLYFGARVKSALNIYLARYLTPFRMASAPADRCEADFRNEYLANEDLMQGEELSQVIATGQVPGYWPLFYSGRLPAAATPWPSKGLPAFTRWGLLHLIKRLGADAGIKDACCVHALRRTFAVQMLRNGANVFSVQAMLGHTDLQQTRQYCLIALTDAEEQHLAYSPADRLPVNSIDGIDQ